MLQVLCSLEALMNFGGSLDRSRHKFLLGGLARQIRGRGDGISAEGAPFQSGRLYWLENARVCEASAQMTDSAVAHPAA